MIARECAHFFPRDDLRVQRAAFPFHRFGARRPHDSHTHHHLRGPSHAHWKHPRVGPRYGPQQSPAASLSERVQAALQQRGYYRGPIDGIAGGGTAWALRAFQNAAGLPVSGRIDRATLARLGVK